MMWEKLEQVNVENKEGYLIPFKELIKNMESGEYGFNDLETEDYYIINEANRKGSKFVHIIPGELIGLFNEMKKETPDEFLGSTVLIKGTRVSCFGIPCTELTKAIIN